MLFMKFNIDANGNLELTREEAEKEELQEMLDKATHKDHGFLADVLEDTGWQPNGMLYQVQPEWIGALTDAPLLADDVDYSDDDTPTVTGTVWWFPNYMVESFAETLIRTGKVVFTKAPD
jgi:hypothetical protein